MVQDKMPPGFRGLAAAVPYSMLSAPPLSFSLSLVSASSLSQSVARLFAACAKGPQSREASRPACVTRCSSSAVVLVLAMLMLVPSRIWLL